MIQHHPHLRSRIIISTWESYHPHLRSRMEAVDSSCICYILMLSSPGKIKKGGNSISLSEIKWYRISLKRFGGQHRHIVSDLLIEVCTLEIFLFWRRRPSTCDGLGGWASWLNYTKFVFDCQLTCSFKCFISPNCCTTDLPKHQVPVGFANCFGDGFELCTTWQRGLNWIFYRSWRRCDSPRKVGLDNAKFRG